MSQNIEEKEIDGWKPFNCLNIDCPKNETLWVEYIIWAGIILGNRTGIKQLKYMSSKGMSGIIKQIRRSNFGIWGKRRIMN